MANTTMKKEFKAQVQEHIIDCLSTDEYTELPFQLNQVVEEFKNWYGPYEQRRVPSRQNAFKDWLQGLPSCLSVEYVNYNIIQLVCAWFESMGETYKEPKDDEQTYTLYYWLIYREFQTLCKKNGVEF